MAKTPEEKLRSLIDRGGHSVHLAMTGAARSSALAPRASVKATKTKMASDVGEAIQGARKRASALGFQAFEEMTGLHYADTVLSTSKREAESLADQWVDSYVALGEEASYADAARSLSWAAERTARTEIVREYNEAIREATEKLSDRGRRFVRTWTSALETNTCPVCEELHGTQVGSYEEFPEGDPPLHPNCLCWTTVELADDDPGVDRGNDGV